MTPYSPSTPPRSWRPDQRPSAKVDELGSEASQAIAYAPLDRAFRQAEEPGDVGIAAITEVGEDDRLALLGVEDVECVDDAFSVEANDHVLGNEVDGGRLFSIDLFFASGSRLVRPHAVDGSPFGDGRCPAMMATDRPVDSVGLHPQFEHHVLHDLVSFSCASHLAADGNADGSADVIVPTDE